MDEADAQQSEALYPVGEGEEDSAEPVIAPRREAHLTFLNCLGLVVSLQIGSGIFSAPSQVSNHTTSPAFGVLAWMVAGVIVYAGAMTFAELGIRLPKNGGVQEYLRYAYGDVCGCVFSWTWILIAKPSSMAIICTVFADYFCRSLLPTSWVSTLTEKLVAFVGLLTITCINCIGVRSGAVAANVFLCSKAFTILSISLSGLVYSISFGEGYLTSRPELPSGDPAAETAGPLWSSFGDFVTAMFGALFCYGGWESAGLVAGEMKDPSKDLPRVLKVSVTSVVSASVLFNAALYCVIPFQVIRDTKTPVVEFAEAIFGVPGGFIYSFLVALSAIGSLNANIYYTGRIYVSAAERGWLPAFFSEQPHTAKLHTFRHEQAIPLSFLPGTIRDRVEATVGTLWVTGGRKALNRAMITNAFIISLYLLGGTIDRLMTFVGMSEYAFLSLAVAGTVLVRRKSLQHIVTYKAHSLYIGIFCIGGLLLVIRGIVTSPLQGVSIALLAGGGWLLHRFILA